MKRTNSVGYELVHEDIIEILKNHVALEEGVDPANVELAIDVSQVGKGAFTSSKHRITARAAIKETNETTTPTKVVPLSTVKPWR